MPSIPEYPDIDGMREQMFPGKQDWELSITQRHALRDAMTPAEKVFEAEKLAWERYFAMVGNSKARLQVARSPEHTPSAKHDGARVLTKREREKANRYRSPSNSVPPVSQDTWNITVPQGDATPALLASGYVLFTEHGSDASHLMKYVDNASLPAFYSSLEAARVAIMSGQWHHREDDVRNALGNQMRSAVEAYEYASDYIAPFMAVRAQAWGLDPWDVVSIAQSDAAVFAQGFASEIERAVHHADDSVVLDVAMQLAVQHELKSQAPTVCDYPPPPSDEPETTDDDDGDDDGDGGGASSSTEEVEVEAEDVTSAQDEEESDNGGDDDDTPVPTPQPIQVTVTPTPAQMKAARDAIEKDVRAALGKAKGQVTRTKNRLKGITDNIGSVQVSYAGDHLLNIYPTPLQELIQGSTSTLDIKQSRGTVSSTQCYVGEPSQKTWELSFGKTKVFRRAAAKRGRIGILIDISGSMGCGCVSCASDRPDSTAALAYAAAKSLAELDSDAIVSAYCGVDEIYRLQPGHTLTHEAYQHTGGATPTCAALEWLEKAMGGELEGATCVLITDGHPSACGAQRRPREHTAEIANRMYNAGMKFGCVVVQAREDVVRDLPKPVTVVVNNQRELGNIQKIIDAMGGM